MIDNESACMIKLPDETFVETREYLRFVEFCDATKHALRPSSALLKSLAQPAGTACFRCALPALS